MPPSSFDFVGRWRILSEEIMAAIQAWRRQHPKATLQEMKVTYR